MIKKSIRKIIKIKTIKNKAIFEFIKYNIRREIMFNICGKVSVD